jgi:hypothetical protein
VLVYDQIVKKVKDRDVIRDPVGGGEGLLKVMRVFMSTTDL